MIVYRLDANRAFGKVERLRNGDWKGQRVLGKSNAIRKCFNLHRNFVCHGREKGIEDAMFSIQLVKKEYFLNTSNPSSWKGGPRIACGGASWAFSG